MSVLTPGVPLVGGGTSVFIPGVPLVGGGTSVLIPGVPVGSSILVSLDGVFQG